jgi:lipopolysaccharide export LptBFGC system permease protein LptF
MLGLVGIPLGAYRKKGTRSYGFVLCIVVLFLYYFFLNLGESLAKRGVLYPALGIWMPNVILGLMGLYCLRVVGREKPLVFLNWIEELINIISSVVQRRFKQI